MLQNVILSSIYLATGSDEKQNLLAQAGIGKLKVPTRHELFCHYECYDMPGTTLEHAFANAQGVPDIFRSPMIGDVILLESLEDWEDWEAYLIVANGFEKIEFDRE